VEVNGSPRVLDELNQLPLKVVNGETLYLRDVAQVRDGSQPQVNIVRQDGRRGALLTILKSGQASTLEVIKRVKEAMPKIIAGLPPEWEIREFADQSRFVRAAIEGVAEEGVIAASLTDLIILLFIGSWRSTIIIALSIPLSVLASLALLSALGQTLNLMTLGGLALAVGVLVDDATVEIENAHRQMALGKPLEQAILDGAQEIALPAFVSTLYICIVFVPMFLLTGVAKHLFVPLAQAVVFARLASYLLSRTLIPTLMMRFYRTASQWHGGEAITARSWTRPFRALQNTFERGFTWLRDGYRQSLASWLTRRGTLIGLVLLFCAVTSLLIPFLGQDFLPTVDAGQFRRHLRAPSGTRIVETARLTDEVEQVIREVVPTEELAGMLDNIGIPTSGISLSYSTSGLTGVGDSDILVSLKPGHAPTAQYVDALRTRLNREFPGTLFYFLPADIVSQTLNFGLPAPLDTQFVGRDQNANRAAAARLATKIREVPGVVDVRMQQAADQPKLQIDMDRVKAGELGFTGRDIANSVLLSLSGSGQVQPGYWLNPKVGIQYLVNVRAPEHVMDSVEALKGIPIISGRGTAEDQLLANVATVHRSMGPAVISHYNAVPVIDLFRGVNGRDLGGVMRDLRPLIEEARKELPRGTSITIRGVAETMCSSYSGLMLGLAVAIVLIYLVRPHLASKGNKGAALGKNFS